MDTTPHTIRATLGAVLIGGFVSIFLSGIVTMQIYLYHRIYVKDAWYLKVIVTAVWLLDLIHTVMVCTSNWTYLILHFGNTQESDHIIWSIAVTIALTAVLTFCVHCFFTHRIYAVSRRNWFITFPVLALALFRMVIALVTTAKMIESETYQVFISKYKWMFTMGLVASAVLDIAIALGLSFYLRKNKSGFSTMDEIIDILVLYTVETGFVTCATTVVSLICWLSMSHNLVFLGLHFTISKLYANSLLATLNSRKTLQGRSQASSDRDKAVPMPILFPSNRYTSRRENPLTSRAMEISVQQTIHQDIDGATVDLDVEQLRNGDDESTDKPIKSL